MAPDLKTFHLTSRHFCFLSLLGWILTDYSRANYIHISDGSTIIWNETSYIGHTSNLTEYKRDVQETIELTHIRTLLTILGVHRRHAKSINFLGSVLKVLDFSGRLHVTNSNDKTRTHHGKK